MVVKSLMAQRRAGAWSLVGIVVAGFLLMLVARFGLKSWFFQIRGRATPAPVMASRR